MPPWKELLNTHSNLVYYSQSAQRFSVNVSFNEKRPHLEGKLFLIIGLFSLFLSCVCAAEAPVATQRIGSVQVWPCHGISVLTVQQ